MVYFFSSIGTDFIDGGGFTKVLGVVTIRSDIRNDGEKILFKKDLGLAGFRSGMGF